MSLIKGEPIACFLIILSYILFQYWVEIMVTLVLEQCIHAHLRHTAQALSKHCPSSCNSNLLLAGVSNQKKDAIKGGGMELKGLVSDKR